MTAFLDDRAGLVLPAPAPSSVDGLSVRAIIDPDDKQRLSYVRTVDVRTGMARGLVEYLSGLSIIWDGGRRHSFASAKAAWAEPEEPAKYPGLVVLGSSPMEYDSTCFKNRFLADDGSGRYLRQPAEADQAFDLIIWANDPVSRMALVAMVEDALEPAEFMLGLRLELPFYFNARATYMKTDLLFDDSAGDAQRRYRRAVIHVDASAPQLVQVVDLPNMGIQLEIDADDE